MLSSIDNTSNDKVKLNRFEKIILFLYAMYFIMNPFYLWSSGLPQIADFLLIISMILYLFSLRFKLSIGKHQKSLLMMGLLFVVWIILVNSVWMLKLQVTDRFILSTLFFIYNYMVFLYTMLLANKYGEYLVKIIYAAVIISLIIQLIMYFSQGGFVGGRQTGSFNNPNQLGYYALLMMSFLMFSSSRINVKIRWHLFAIFTSIIFVFSSLSKAAILSGIGLLVFYIFANSSNRRFKKKIIIVALILSVIAGIIYSTTNIIQDNQLINSVQRRIDGIGNDSDDSLEGRGYYRIYEYPEYWLFGAGEGMYSRFRHQSMEFHSTLGNIQLSYGIIGTLLFISIMIMALKRDKYKSWYILVFVMAYGLTHNGIRNSLLWILLALMTFNIKEQRINGFKKTQYSDNRNKFCSTK